MNLKNTTKYKFDLFILSEMKRHTYTMKREREQDEESGTESESKIQIAGERAFVVIKQFQTLLLIFS